MQSVFFFQLTFKILEQYPLCSDLYIFNLKKNPIRVFSANINILLPVENLMKFLLKVLLEMLQIYCPIAHRSIYFQSVLVASFPQIEMYSMNPALFLFKCGAYALRAALVHNNLEYFLMKYRKLYTQSHQ